MDAAADCCNLLLLAECACDVAAQARQSSQKPPFLHLPPPEDAQSSPCPCPCPCRRRRVLPPASWQSAAPKLNFMMGLGGNAPYCSSAVSLPSPREEKPPASSSLTLSIPAPEIPPFSFQPFKKICGPGPPLRRKPTPSSLPYKKLRRRHRPQRGWLETRLRLKGTMPMWFGRKLLTATDVGVHFNRLSLPKEAVGSMMASAMMTDAEKLDARLPDRGLPVPVLDRMGRTWNLVLKYWSSSKAQVLHGEWNDLVEMNHLRANVDWVDFWGFRANGPNGPLWLAVV
ncbi:hypothetical protein ACLOJK_026129 [Asimina triloba]